MSLKQDIREFRRAEREKAVAAYDNAPDRKTSPIKYILEQQKVRTRQDLLRLRLAIDTAENIRSYNRQQLHEIYREVIKDPNLWSQWTSRKMKVKEKPFKIVKPDGTENQELTNLFEHATWFYDWMDACLDSKLWGFSLIEFGPLENGEFLPYKVGEKYYNSITVIDRDNVKPELGIITNLPGDIEGISIDDKKFSKYLMLVCSDFRDTGILMNAAKYILFKDNALGNWSEWAEVFGMDKRIGYTDAAGQDRTDFLRALRDMGSNAYGVFTSRDKIEYLGTQRTDAFQVYNQLIKYVDEQTAKLIFGQDVVSNNTGKVVGSVGENIANMYGQNDARFIATLVNKKLIPLMENLGYLFQDNTFRWDNTEKISLSDRATIDATISRDMGKEHSDQYINDTYGVDVTKKEVLPEINSPEKVNKDLKNEYGF